MTGWAVELALRRLARGDQVGGAIGLLLVRVSALANTALELHPAALLDDVRGLVSGGVKARRVRERDMVPGRVGLGTDRPARGGGGATHVGLDATDVVAAEQLLDRGPMGHRAADSSDPLGSQSLNLVTVGARG